MMDSYSSVLHEEKNNNRLNPSRMNNIDPTHLARLRPEKLDDAAVKEQISIIQKACDDVDPDTIALVFHECEYNMQKTIARIRAGDFQDEGWQTAKSTNKKKVHHQSDQGFNGGTLSDSERSLSQRTSPTSSLRGERRRNDQCQYPSSDARQRRNGASRNQFNPRSSIRANPTPKLVVPTPSEASLPSKQSNEEYELVDEPIQSLTFENSQKKTSIYLSSKRRIPSIIPQEPVSMHPTVQFSTEPLDIQFGDIQWNDSVPRAVSPSAVTSTVFEHQEEEIPLTVNTENQGVQDALSSNYIVHQPTNDTDNQLLETTDQFSSSLSIADNTIPNNIPIVSSEGTSHLSDQLSNPSSSIPLQYSSQSQEPVQIPITRLPPTSTPRLPEYTSSTPQFIPNNNATSAAFTPFNRVDTYSSMPREYSQPTNWNPASSNYKTTSKTTMIPSGTYQQQPPSYPIPPQQQPFFVGTYPYSTLPPTVLQVFTPVEHWSSTGYSTPLESYPYPTANYIPTYSAQPQYQPPTKYDPHSYDKEFFARYGQSRPSNNDLSYQQAQPSAISSQPAKDAQINSKLSPTAATFSQGAPLTASPSATTLYINPTTFSIPNYYPSMGGTTHQDRTFSYPSMGGTTHQDRTFSYPSIDNRDNRSGAPNHRTNYYHPGQQRTHNNNVSNSTWHLQQ